MDNNYTAEERVFGIPELRRYILSFYLDKKNLLSHLFFYGSSLSNFNFIATPPAQCCCVLYCFGWIAYKTDFYTINNGTTIT